MLALDNVYEISVRLQELQQTLIPVLYNQRPLHSAGHLLKLLLVFVGLLLMVMSITLYIRKHQNFGFR
jgi:hypothetical protein